MNVTDEVVITSEDLKDLVNGLEAFGAKVSEGLQKAIDRFELTPSLDNQREVQLQMARLIGDDAENGDFKEELFNGLVKECKEFADGK